MTMNDCELRGITWDHSRAFPPLVATAQRFGELNPGVRVTWEKRSLHAFGHANVAELAQQFDLVVMDHPWCGFAVDHNVFVDLNTCADPDVLAELHQQSVGNSAGSYLYNGQLIALPIDAATPVASYRPDLLAPANVPQTWDELLSLAGKGRVAASGFHVDLLLHLVMLVVSLGGKPFESPDEWATPDIAEHAMQMLGELFRLLPKECLEWNPIAVYEHMTRYDDVIYCPFAYSYSNYARPGFALHPLANADLVSIGSNVRLRSVLGGTGVALSRNCKAKEQALAYMSYIASARVQNGIYVAAGGQPAHRAAWTDSNTNASAGSFFSQTLAATDRAYTRPRYNGFLQFQETAGLPLLDWIRSGGPVQPTLQRINDLYRNSRHLGVSQEN